MAASSSVFAKRHDKNGLIVLMPIGAKDSINPGPQRDCNASIRHFSTI